MKFFSQLNRFLQIPLEYTDYDSKGRTEQILGSKTLAQANHKFSILITGFESSSYTATLS